MEGFDQESIKHICKFCNKSFPCGRSLGGHMRSHVMINSPDHHHHQKLSSFNNNGGFMNNNNNNGSLNSNDSCYELRKDPKKTIKSKDSNQKRNQISSSSSVLDKLCKECGKGFQSWKALFGHMKCHSKKVLNNKHNNNSASLNHNSWTSKSDNENSDGKIHRIKRSRSRNKRYYYSPAKTAITTTSSSISMNNNNQISSNNASTSVVSEIDQDQEQEADVAMSLMMLSKDVGKWGNQFGSSDCCSSSFLGKNVLKNGFKMKKSAKTEVGIDFLGRSEVGYEGFERISTKNDEFTSCSFDEIKDYSSKRKFECVSCNKSFHSYQALGGHKASHKKVKICFDSKPANENTIQHEPVLDHDQIINGYDPKTSYDHQEPSSFNLGHECSICLKMFSSGQALGGHKRSHVINEPKTNQESCTNAIKGPDEKPICKTRRFLDLNMPPEEEKEEEEEEEMVMKSSCTTKFKSYYWEDCSDHHNHESRLLGLLSTS